MPRTEQEIVQQLLGILQHYAPTGSEQQACSQLLWDMQADSAMDDGKIIGVLAGAIHDGLHFGNWPWNMANIAAQDGSAPAAPGE